MGVVDDDSIGDEVVVLLHREVVGVLDPLRLDRDDSVPEDIGCGDPGETERVEEAGEAHDGRAAEAALPGRTFSIEVLHRDAGELFDLHPAQPRPLALLIHPRPDFPGNGVLAAALAGHGREPRPEHPDLALTTDDVRCDPAHERRRRPLAQQVDRAAGPSCPTVLELLPVEPREDAAPLRPAERARAAPRHIHHEREVPLGDRGAVEGLVPHGSRQPKVCADLERPVPPLVDARHGVREVRDGRREVVDEHPVPIEVVERRGVTGVPLGQQPGERDEFMPGPRPRARDFEPSRRGDTVARLQVFEVLPAVESTERVIRRGGDAPA